MRTIGPNRFNQIKREEGMRTSCTIFLVQFLDLKCKLALGDDIVIEFVPVYLVSISLVYLLDPKSDRLV
jgi:hypothetical protein